MSQQNPLIEAMSADTAAKDGHCRLKDRKAQLDFEWGEEHVDRGLAQLTLRIPAVVKSCARAGEDPFAKVKDSITDPINRLQTKAHSEVSQSEASLTGTNRRLEPSSRLWSGMCSRVEVKADQSQKDAPMHQGDCAMIKQVVIPQIQHSATRISAGRGRNVADQLHSTWSPGRDARNEHDLRKNKWKENKDCDCTRRAL